jgi:hypothetical protein
LPAAHAGEQEVHVVAPLVKEKLEPAMQEVHTLSVVVVQAALRYVPAAHAGEQEVHTVAPLVVENEVPVMQGVHALSDVFVQRV